MANEHWSQFSHEPKILFISPWPFVVLFISIIGFNIHHSMWWLIFTLAVWIYVIIFEKFLKMPMRYTWPLIRSFLVGNTKHTRVRNNRFEL